MKKLNLFFGLSLLLLLACTQDDFSDAQPEGERPRASHVVPVGDALGVLEQFLAPLGDDTRSGARYAIEGVDVIASGTATRSGRGADTLLYIVNFENEGGYALLGADKRIDPVIALVDAGNMTAEEFLASATSNDSSSETDDINSEILVYCQLAKHRYDGDVSSNQSPLYYTPWITEVMCHPMLNTRWHQNWPFNAYCPIKDGKQCIAGCVAVAVAQIVAYNRSVYDVGPDELRGYELDWNAIFEDMRHHSDEHPNAFSSAFLIRAAGKAALTKYGIERSGSNLDGALNALHMVGYFYLVSIVMEPIM